MKRREFFKFLPAAGAGVAVGAVMGKPEAKPTKVPVFLRPNPKPHDPITIAGIQGETVMVDMTLPLEKQFSGEYLERVRLELAGRDAASHSTKDGA